MALLYFVSYSLSTKSVFEKGLRPINAPKNSRIYGAKTNSDFSLLLVTERCTRAKQLSQKLLTLLGCNYSNIAEVIQIWLIFF